MDKLLPTDSIRCFVATATPLSTEAMQPLMDELEGLRRPHLINARVVAEKDRHITLKFLGNIDVDQVGYLDSILRHHSARQSPMSLRCRGLGMFIDTLYLGIDWNDALWQLASNLNEAYAFLGFPLATKRFLPHITVAHFNRAYKPDLARLIMAKYRNRAWGSLTIESIRLYRSDMYAEESDYVLIADYPLQG